MKREKIATAGAAQMSNIHRVGPRTRPVSVKGCADRPWDDGPIYDSPDYFALQIAHQ